MIPGTGEQDKLTTPSFSDAHLPNPTVDTKSVVAKKVEPVPTGRRLFYIYFEIQSVLNNYKLLTTT